MNISIKRLLKMKKFIFWINSHTPMEKQSNQDWKTPIYLKIKGPHVKVPLIFWFLIITFKLFFYHELWVKWVCIRIGNRSGHITPTYSGSRSVCWFLTLNEMHIELASLIICSINDNLTNTLSIPPPEVRKNGTVYSTFNNFLYLNKNSIN